MRLLISIHLFANIFATSLFAQEPSASELGAFNPLRRLQELRSKSGAAYSTSKSDQAEIEKLEKTKAEAQESIDGLREKSEEIGGRLKESGDRLAALNSQAKEMENLFNSKVHLMVHVLGASKTIARTQEELAKLRAEFEELRLKADELVKKMNAKAPDLKIKTEAQMKENRSLIKTWNADEIPPRQEYYWYVLVDLSQRGHVHVTADLIPDELRRKPPGIPSVSAWNETALQQELSLIGSTNNWFDRAISNKIDANKYAVFAAKQSYKDIEAEAKDYHSAVSRMLELWKKSREILKNARESLTIAGFNPAESLSFIKELVKNVDEAKLKIETDQLWKEIETLRTEIVKAEGFRDEIRKELAGVDAALGLATAAAGSADKSIATLKGDAEKRRAELANVVQFHERNRIDEWVLTQGQPGDSIGAQNYVISLVLQNEAKLPPYKQIIWEHLRDRKSIPFIALTRAFLLEHTNASSRQKNPRGSTYLDHSIMIEKWMKSIFRATTLDHSAVPEKLKAAVETEIQKRAGEPINYNRSAINLTDIPLDNRLQCSSGTMFNQFMCRLFYDAKNFQAQNFVLIHESGHILLGQMIKNDSGEWTLRGFESTAEGEAVIKYGKATELKGGVRVVDAELFLLTEVFKNDIQNRSEVRDAALKWTAEKYGIQLQSFDEAQPASKEEAVKLPKQQVFEKNTETGKPAEENSLPVLALNQSLFAFGGAIVPEGDQPRAKFKDINRNDIDDLRGRAPESLDQEPIDLKGVDFNSDAGKKVLERVFRKFISSLRAGRVEEVESGEYEGGGRYKKVLKGFDLYPVIPRSFAVIEELASQENGKLAISLIKDRIKSTITNSWKISGSIYEQPRFGQYTGDIEHYFRLLDEVAPQTEDSIGPDSPKK